MTEKGEYDTIDVSVFLRRKRMNYQNCYSTVCYAFNKPNTLQREKAFQQLFENSYSFVKEEENIIANHLLASPLQMNIKNNIVPILGIGYVASLPEYRGNGGIKALFNELTQFCKKEAYPISFLAPFSQPFYRQFGYENIMNQTIYHFDSQALNFLNKTKEGSYNRELINEKNSLKIKEIYNKVTTHLNGALIRSNWWMTYQQIKHHPRYVVFYTYNKQESYMIYHIDGETFYIDELIYINKEHLTGLLNFAKSHQMTVKNYQAIDPLEKLPLVFTDNQYIKQTTSPYMMACIHDFSACQYIFNQFLTVDDQPCNIKITNSQNNNQYFTVTHNKLIEKTSIAEEELHYEGSVQAWTQFLLSPLSLKDIQYTPSPIICHHPHPMAEKRDLLRENIHLYDYF